MHDIRSLSFAPRLVVFIVLLCLQSIGHAQSTDVCNESDATRAEDAVDSLKTPMELYNWFKQYKQCDDGGIAEGNSEAVARLLVDHWDKLAELHQPTVKDIGFKKFVLGHIDETINPDDDKQIYKNATTRCPKQLNEFCKEIATVARRLGTMPSTQGE